MRISKSPAQAEQNFRHTVPLTLIPYAFNPSQLFFIPGSVTPGGFKDTQIQNAVWSGEG